MTFKTPAQIIADAGTRDLRHVLIVTPLEHEMQAVQAHIRYLASATGKSGTVYECGDFTAEGDEWLVVVAQSDPGNHPAQYAVTWAHAEFGDFELVLLSGVAGSRKSDVPMGSVIAATQVYTPYSGKYDDGEFASRPRTIPIDHRLVQLALKVSRDRQWHGRIPSLFNGDPLPPPEGWPQPFPPRSFVAPIVSVEAVMADPDSELAAMIDKHGGDAHAVEMEGYGAVFAANRARTPIMVVRGISDMTRNKTPDDDAILQPLAAIFAAAFAFELLNLWSQSNPRVSPALGPAPAAAPTTSPPLANSPQPEPSVPPESQVHETDSSAMAPAPKSVFVLNFEGDPEQFPAERVEAIALSVAEEVGATVNVLRDERGSFRLFVEFDQKVSHVDTDVLRTTLADKHGVELLGAVDEQEYRAIRELASELDAPSYGLLAWPTSLPDGQHMERPELKELLKIVREETSSTTVVLGIPGSGKSALLATFGAAAAREGWPVLAIKADLLPPEVQSEPELQQHLGLSIFPSQLLQRIAAFRPILLVIDQLDALGGYLDLRTGRLSVLLNLVRRLGRTRNIHIALSARAFEFEHDVRLRSVLANSISLQLPPWPEVLEILESHGIKAEGWPLDAQEVMSRPQALATFLRLKDEWGEQPFPTYQAMLDRLWDEQILSRANGTNLARLASDIAQIMAEEENLWLAKARFENKAADVGTLLALEILTTSANEGSIGFTHQTLFDHALARSFAREKGRLSSYVLGRQSSLFIRPKLWAGLAYLRAVERPTYEKELETIWSAPDLRRHLKMLLIDFMGQHAEPTDRESILIAQALSGADLRQVAFRAISGSPGWFRRTSRSFITEAMTRNDGSADLAAGVLSAAWEFAPDDVVALIRTRWFGDPAYDPLSWNVLINSPEWSDEAVDLGVQILARTEVSPSNVDYVVSTLGVGQPEVALKLVRAKLDRDLALAVEESARRQKEVPPAGEEDGITWRMTHSPERPLTEFVENRRDWETLGSLAETAPTATLEGLWPWFVEVLNALRELEGPRNDLLGYAITYHLDYRFEGDHSLGLPEPPLLGALRVAAETLAANDPEAFIAWMEANDEIDAEPAQRLFAHAMASQPERYAQRALKFMLADERRFHMGDIQDRIGTSKRLVRAISPHWSAAELDRFIVAVRAFAPARPAHVTEARSRLSFAQLVRRIHLGLLQSLPQDRVNETVRRLIDEEVRALGDRKVGATFSGVTSVGSPMSRDAFARAADADVIHAFEELPDSTGWDHPRRFLTGGNIQLSREFAEFSKVDPQRAARLIRQFEPTFGQRAAGYAIDAMAGEAEPSLIINLFIETVGRGFDGEEFRNSTARAIERLVRRGHPVADDVLKILEQSLEKRAAPDPDDEPDHGSDETRDETLDDGENGDGQTQSVLWEYSGFSVLPAGNYPVLEAITHILLKRPDHDRLAKILSAHVQRSEDPEIWRALLRFFVYLQPTNKDLRGNLLKDIFGCYPSLLHTREAAEVLAHAQWWAPGVMHEFVAPWRLDDSPRLRQTYGELIALVAIVQPKLTWALHAMRELVSNEDADARLGAAFSAVNLWKERDRRHAATELLAKLIPQADAHIWHAVFDLFRIVDELTPEPDTVRLLQTIAEHVHKAESIDATFVVERLQTLLPHEASLVAKLAQQLTSNWRNELVDLGTATSASASDLVDLAVTLHRLGPETREAGTSLFEDLLFIGAWGARSTLDELDSRFRPGRAPVRRRLPRRSGRRATRVKNKA